MVQGQIEMGLGRLYCINLTSWESVCLLPWKSDFNYMNFNPILNSFSDEYAIIWAMKQIYYLLSLGENSSRSNGETKIALL